MCRCYRTSPVDGNAYPVEIIGGRSFGERVGKTSGPVVCYCLGAKKEQPKQSQPRANVPAETPKPILLKSHSDRVW